MRCIHRVYACNALDESVRRAETGLRPDPIRLHAGDPPMTDIPDTAAVLERYTRAFTQHDPSLLDALVAPDCTIERSKPDAAGTHLVGRDACLGNWRALAANR